MLAVAYIALPISPVFAQSGSIVGQVTAADGTALPGVNIRIENTTLGAAADLNGEFTIENVSAGEQTLVATLVGFRRAEMTVNVPSGGEVRADFRLTEDVLRLSEVAVTASRRQEDLGQVPRAVGVIQAETIESYTIQTSDLSATLGKFVPNFTPPSVGNNVFLATLRGRTPLFLLDGVALQTNEGLRGAVLGNIDPSILERVEVLYGASTAYGGGAPGGVIQFFTKEASEKPLDVDLNLFSRTYMVNSAFFDGDAVDLRTSATVSGTQGKFKYLVNGAFETTNGMFRPDGERIAPIGTTDYDDYAVFTKLSYDLTSTQQVRLTFNHSYREPNNSSFGVGIDPDDATADPDGSAGTAIPVDNPFIYDQPISQRYTSFNAQYAHNDLGGGALRVQGYYFDLNFQQGGSDIRNLLARNGGPFPDTWPGIWQTSTAATQIGGRLEYIRPINNELLITAGGDIQQAEDSTPVTISSDEPFDRENRFDASLGVQDQGAPTEVLSGGVFLQADYDALPNLRLSGGLRYDYNEYTILPFIPTFTRVEPSVTRPGGSGSNSGLSVNLGVAYEVIPRTTLYANFAQGFSLPALAFLVTNVAPDVNISDGELVSPQIVNSIDVGVRGQLGDNLAYGLAGFYAFSEDASQIQFDAATGFGTRVQAPQRNYGAEANVEVAPAEGVRIGVDVAWTETDVDPQDDGTFQPASTIEAVPLTTTLRASYAPPSIAGLSFQAEVYSLSNRYRAFTFLVDSDENGEFELDNEGDPIRADGYILRGYKTIDLGLNYDFPASLVGDLDTRLTLLISNLLNETYIPAISQRQVGAIFADRRRNGPGRALSINLQFNF
ncbi:MAG: TonB-dependent receptor [Bacteroidota bacterium]